VLGFIDTAKGTPISPTTVAGYGTWVASVYKTTDSSTYTLVSNKTLSACPGANPNGLFCYTLTDPIAGNDKTRPS
jgi:hypothetical protein